MGDYLEISFETSNEIKKNSDPSQLQEIFDPKLGFSDYEQSTGTGRALDCSETRTQNKLKATRISCFLVYGDTATGKKAVIKIKVEAALAIS